MFQYFFRSWFLAFAAVLALAGNARAAVTYSVSSVGGNSWQYAFAISNPAPSVAFDEVSIFFDVAAFANLRSEVAPAGWDPLVLQPDLGIPSDGIFDVLRLAGPMAEGSEASGFAVTVDFLGTGTPGSLPFDLLDSLELVVLASGVTELAGPTGELPEPSTAGLVFLGLAGLWCGARNRRIA